MLTRRLLNFITLVSLLLCTAFAILWARSYRAWDRGFVCGKVEGDTQRCLDVSSALGQLSFTVERADGFSLGSSPREGARVYAEDIALARRHPTWLGFALQKQVATLTYDHTARTPPVRTTWTAVVPYGSLVVVTALLPAARLLRRARRRTRSAGGLCPNCGYDLRATPEKCPECGTSWGQSDSSPTMTTSSALIPPHPLTWSPSQPSKPARP